MNSALLIPRKSSRYRNPRTWHLFGRSTRDYVFARADENAGWPDPDHREEGVNSGAIKGRVAPLQTVWGIGKILALTMMYEVGEISRFKKVGNFASYCRLVKTARLSAGKRKGSGNARNGNPYLSWAFSEAAHFAVRYHLPAKKYFQRKRFRRPTASSPSGRWPTSSHGRPTT